MRSMQCNVEFGYQDGINRWVGDLDMTVPASSESLSG
jgi:hypothetical protein